MILINLLPPQLRKERESRLALWKRRRIVKGGGVGFVLLTLLFYLQYQWGLMDLRNLQSQWRSLEQESQRVDLLQKGIEGESKKEDDFLKRYVASPFPTTAILGAVSELLPPSIWLVELRVSRQPKKNTFLLKGISLASEQSSSIQEIEKYLSGLKEKFPPQTDLMLTTSRQLTENRESTLFTAVFEWI